MYKYDFEKFRNSYWNIPNSTRIIPRRYRFPRRRCPTPSAFPRTRSVRINSSFVIIFCWNAFRELGACGERLLPPDWNWNIRRRKHAIEDDPQYFHTCCGQVSTAGFTWWSCAWSEAILFIALSSFSPFSEVSRRPYFMNIGILWGKSQGKFRVVRFTACKSAKDTSCRAINNLCQKKECRMTQELWYACIPSWDVAEMSKRINVSESRCKEW